MKSSRLRRAMRISVAEGVFAQIFSSLSAPGSIFLTKFLLLLNAAPIHFGVLAAIGQLAQVFQPLGSAFARRSESRKPPMLALAAAGRAIPFAFAALPFLFAPRAAIWIFLGLFLVSSALLAVAGNLWIAWISDLFPASIRGRFFSARGPFLLLAGLATGYFFGAFFDLFGTEGWLAGVRASHETLARLFAPGRLPVAFALVFVLAAAVGLVGLWILAAQPERKKALETESVREVFAAPLRDANFRRLLLYGLWWMLAIGIGSPFWQPFMLKNLGMTLLETQIYGTLSVGASLLVLRPWGRFIDRYGNKTAMRLALLLGGLNPMLWLFASPDHYGIVFLEGITSGVMWSGAGIVAANFVLSIAPRGRAQVYSGVFGAFCGVGMTLTMLVSGLLLPPPMRLLGLSLAPEQVLFLLTGLARWSTQIPLTWIREPRARPVGEALYAIVQNVKLRVAHFALFFTVRNDRPKDGP